MRDSLESFIEDMFDSYKEHIETYGRNNTTIDRIDSNHDYCKENCRWATYQLQNENRSSCYKIKHQGDIYTLRGLCKTLGLYEGTFRRYLKQYGIERCNKYYGLDLHLL